MSWYSRFRNEMIVGGADTPEETEQAKKDSAWVGVIVLGLLIWLGIKSPWSLLFVFGIIVSVFLHEVGHFVSARRSGMKVTQFYMGFGPKVWSFTRGEVEYGVRALPIGAFVRIVGMNSEDTVEPEDEPRAYRAQSYPKRMITITAGSLMHMVIAGVLMIGVYSTAGRYQDTGTLRLLEAPIAGTPAEEIGLQAGDVIVSLDGEPMRSREGLWTAINERNPGDTIDLLIERNGSELTLKPTLASVGDGTDHPYLGVFTGSNEYVRMDPARALWWGAGDIVDIVARSARGVITALNPMNSVEHLTDPDGANLDTRPTTVVGATQFSDDIGREDGLKGVLFMLAAVNVFVGVFNMFPMLPFDGGHAAIATYERLRSRKGRRYHADVAKMIPVTMVVLALVLFLFATGLYLDIAHPIG